jgi:hypothetical protein
MSGHIGAATPSGPLKAICVLASLSLATERRQLRMRHSRQVRGGCPGAALAASQATRSVPITKTLFGGQPGPHRRLRHPFAVRAGREIADNAGRQHNTLPPGPPHRLRLACGSAGQLDRPDVAGHVPGSRVVRRVRPPSSVPARRRNAAVHRGVKNADTAGPRGCGKFPHGRGAAAGHVNPDGRGRHGGQHARSCHHLAHLTRAGQPRDEDIGARGYLRERGVPLRPALNDRSFKFSTRVTRSHRVPAATRFAQWAMPSALRQRTRYASP